MNAEKVSLLVIYCNINSSAPISPLLMTKKMGSTPWLGAHFRWDQINKVDRRISISISVCLLYIGTLLQTGLIDFRYRQYQTRIAVCLSGRGILLPQVPGAFS